MTVTNSPTNCRSITRLLPVKYRMSRQIRNPLTKSFASLQLIVNNGQITIICMLAISFSQSMTKNETSVAIFFNISTQIIGFFLWIVYTYFSRQAKVHLKQLRLVHVLSHGQFVQHLYEDIIYTTQHRIGFYIYVGEKKTPKIQ